MTARHDDPDDDAAEALRRACASLPKELAPPADLEEKVVSELKARGGIRLANRSWRYAMAAGGLGAALVLFAAGIWTGWKVARPLPSAEASASSPARWALFLYEDDGYQAAPPAEAAGRVREYREWARVLASRGALVAGEKLNEAGKLLARSEGRVRVSDGLPRSGDGAVTGYFVIRAGTLDEALALASDCPHLKHGGRISLRRIDPT